MCLATVRQRALLSSLRCMHLQELAPLRISPVVAGLHRASPSAALDKSSTYSVVMLEKIYHSCHPLVKLFLK
ncbi:hypothetical protein ALPO108162_16975 [Alicyclobacillus pomorum]